MRVLGLPCDRGRTWTRAVKAAGMRLRRFFILALTGLALLGGCSGGNGGSSGGPPGPGPTPATPAPAGTRASNLYVATAQVPARVAGMPAISDGSVTPPTLITGSNAGIAESFFAYADTLGRVWVTSCLQLNPGGPLVAFNAKASGNATPVISIGGSTTTLSQCQGGVAVDASGNVYVVDVDATAQYPGGHVSEFAANATGDVAPIRIIGGPSAGFQSPTGIAVDSSGNVYVADSCQGYTCSGDVRVFAAAAGGNVAPMRVISGSATNLVTPEGLALDRSGNIYVANVGTNAINIYSGKANGNTGPIRFIGGASTRINAPAGISVDAAGYTYLGNQSQSPNNAPVLVFAPGAAGNVAPVQSITLNVLNATEPAGVATF
jgi:sugar lactone lactonase YvrE